MPEFTIAPRRVTATSTLHLLPEPRMAWQVPVIEPWDVDPKPRWRIIGMTYGAIAVEYETAQGAGKSEIGQLYQIAEESAANLAAILSTIRYVPDGAGESTDLLHPEGVAFSVEDARERAHVRRTAAEAKRAEVVKP